MNMIESKRFLITPNNVDRYINEIGKFIKDAVVKNNRQGGVLGMSGGIDCSVVARLCQKAGVDINLYMLPDGLDTNSDSYLDALKLTNKFNFKSEVIDIKPICDAFEKQMPVELQQQTAANVRPRIRMSVLYSLAQEQHRFVIGTGNFDERLLGYFTKWGDGASDINPLAMITKAEVRILAKALDVPQSIIDKAPSAGLFDGQTDEEELGLKYQQIDDFVIKGSSGYDIIDRRIQNRINLAEHKNNPIPIFDGSKMQYEREPTR